MNSLSESIFAESPPSISQSQQYFPQHYLGCQASTPVTRSDCSGSQGRRGPHSVLDKCSPIRNDSSLFLDASENFAEPRPNDSISHKSRLNSAPPKTRLIDKPASKLPFFLRNDVSLNHSFVHSDLLTDSLSKSSRADSRFLSERLNLTSNTDSNKVDEGEDDEYASWITVFGFPREQANEVLEEFEQFGKVERRVLSGDGNWAHIKYQSKFFAHRAIARYGKFSSHFMNKVMIGVIPCQDKELMKSHKNLKNSAISFEDNRMPCFSGDNMNKISRRSDRQSYDDICDQNINPALYHSVRRSKIRPLAISPPHPNNTGVRDNNDGTIFQRICRYFTGS